MHEKSESVVTKHAMSNAGTMVLVRDNDEQKTVKLRKLIDVMCVACRQ